ncbi:MAG: hypothetical protein HYX61_04255 [Gammaproteobacteria bacterium]|jgi:hypothetical protein|nr:hypothetical protein [Gammaproteobacteria bacterium]
MKDLNGKILDSISGGNDTPYVTPYGATGVIADDYWYARINANIPVYDNTFISPNITYVDQIGFINPGIQITHQLD